MFFLEGGGGGCSGRFIGKTISGYISLAKDKGVMYMAISHLLASREFSRDGTLIK